MDKSGEDHVFKADRVGGPGNLDAKLAQDNLGSQPTHCQFFQISLDALCGILRQAFLCDVALFLLIIRSCNLVIVFIPRDLNTDRHRRRTCFASPLALYGPSN
jgi:hypothetical protein